MTPHYSDDWLTLYGGDCREVLASLPSDSVDCVVTSPPYWGLRDYGTATWEGGDAECDHIASYGAGRPGRETPGGRGGSFPHNDIPHKDICGKCGATRQDSQLGLERTPEEYVANMVAVFREVRRVLKPSGTLWLNLGDSYNNRTKVRTSSHQPSLNGFEDDNWADRAARGGVRMSRGDGIKEKDLVGIPWRVAFALQADGWYLRSDIIWSKPNPMPESVTDRPTKSHEYLFLLTKSARYYFDADAVREPHTDPTVHRNTGTRGSQGYAVASGPGRTGKGIQRDSNGGLGKHPAGRNIRSVWNIATRPYPGAHFAVFPPELPERCIKAGSSEKGVCPECGAPWERVVERPEEPDGLRSRGNGAKLDYHTRQTGSGQKLQDWMDANPKQTTGWRAACLHWLRWASDREGYEMGVVESLPPEPVPEPAVILDPFGGSGTVGMVANRLSRRAILIDLNPEYLKQQMKRNAQTPLGLDAA